MSRRSVPSPPDAPLPFPTISLYPPSLLGPHSRKRSVPLPSLVLKVLAADASMQTAEEYIWSDTLKQTLKHWLAEVRPLLLNFTTLPSAHVLYPHDDIYDSGKRSSKKYNSFKKRTLTTLASPLLSPSMHARRPRQDLRHSRNLNLLLSLFLRRLSSVAPLVRERGGGEGLSAGRAGRREYGCRGLAGTRAWRVGGDGRDRSTGPLLTCRRRRARRARKRSVLAFFFARGSRGETYPT